MKTILTILPFLLFFTVTTMAQDLDFVTEKSRVKHFHKNSLLLNIGSDLLAFDKPTADIGIEYGLTNRLGIGLNARYHTFNNMRGNFLSSKERLLTSSAVIYFHFIQNKKWDFYSLAGAGMSFGRNINTENQTVTSTTYSSALEYGIGGRYYFSNRFGAFAELKKTAHSGLQGKLGVQFKLVK
jgi:hypothetical protein